MALCPKNVITQIFQSLYNFMSTLVIGEITCSKMMIVLNKVDMLPPDSRDAAIQKMMKKMRATLSKTKFKEAPIVSVAAKCGGSDDGGPSDSIGQWFLTFCHTLPFLKIFGHKLPKNPNFSQKK